MLAFSNAPHGRYPQKRALFFYMRLKQLSINAMAQRAQLWRRYRKAVFGYGKNIGDPLERCAQLARVAAVRVPKRDRFMPAMPPVSAQHDVLRVHMHKHRIVLMAQFKNVAVKAPYAR